MRADRESPPGCARRRARRWRVDVAKGGAVRSRMSKSSVALSNLRAFAIVMVVAFYPVYRAGALDPSWSAFWSHWIALPFWPSGPMWFLWVLLLFNIAAAALFWLAPRAGESLGRLAAKAGEHPGRAFIAFVAVSALAYLPLSAVFAPWVWVQFGPFAVV